MTDATAIAQPGLAADLKERTQHLHTRAERHPFQADLIRGRLSPEAYAAYLGQLEHVHVRLEQLLKSDGAAVLRQGLYQPWHDRAAHFRADRAALGHSEAAPPLGAAAATLGMLSAADDPQILAGFLYVLEGSTNGGRYIARALRGSLSWAADCTSNFDPHGEAQAERWAAFKVELDRLALTPAQRERVIEGADLAFTRLIAIFDELLAAAPAPR